MAGGQPLLSGAKQQPAERPELPRDGEATRQRLETDKQNFLLFKFKPLFLFQLWVSTQIGAEVFWIGLNDQVTEGVWEWSDGTTYIEYYSYVNLI